MSAPHPMLPDAAYEALAAAVIDAATAIERDRKKPEPQEAVNHFAKARRSA